MYIVAGVLGWFVHPVVAVAIFIFIVAYYAWNQPGDTCLPQRAASDGAQDRSGGGNRYPALTPADVRHSFERVTTPPRPQVDLIRRKRVAETSLQPQYVP